MDASAAIEVLLAELRRLRAEGVESVAIGPEAEARLTEWLGRRGAGPGARDVPRVSAAGEPSPVPVSGERRVASAKASPSLPVAPPVPRVVASEEESLPPPPVVALSPAGDPAARLAELRNLVLACPECRRRAGPARQPYFGWGSVGAELMLVGDHPGEEEAATGDPFAGPAGELLGKALRGMGLARERVHVTHLLRWRPLLPGGQGTRPATPGEVAFCLPYLRAQLAAVAPRVVVALGKGPLNALAAGGEGALSITRERGVWREVQGVPMMPTYLPAYLLRNPSAKVKREFWEDLLAVMGRLGLPVSDRQRRHFLPGGSAGAGGVAGQGEG